MNKIIFTSLILTQFLFTQQLGDIVYKYNGEVIRGNMISGGNSGDYYVQIKSEDGYINIYMYEVKEIKRQVPIPKQESSVLPQEKNLTPSENLPETKKYVQQNIIEEKQKENHLNKVPIANIDEITEEAAQNKMMMYQTQKKSEGTAMLLSFIIPSAGHLYAGNWGRGIGFVATEVGLIFMASTVGISENCQTQYGSFYSYSSCNYEPNGLFYVGFFGAIGIRLPFAVSGGSGTVYAGGAASVRPSVNGVIIPAYLYMNEGHTVSTMNKVSDATEVAVTATGHRVYIHMAFTYQSV